MAKKRLSDFAIHRKAIFEKNAAVQVICTGIVTE